MLLKGQVRVRSGKLSFLKAVADENCIDSKLLVETMLFLPSFIDTESVELIGKQPFNVIVV